MLLRPDIVVSKKKKKKELIEANKLFYFLKKLFGIVKSKPDYDELGNYFLMLNNWMIK